MLSNRDFNSSQAAVPGVPWSGSRLVADKGPASELESDYSEEDLR